MKSNLRTDVTSHLRQTATRSHHSVEASEHVPRDERERLLRRAQRTLRKLAAGQLEGGPLLLAAVVWPSDELLDRERRNEEGGDGDRRVRPGRTGA